MSARCVAGVPPDVPNDVPQGVPTCPACVLAPDMEDAGPSPDGWFGRLVPDLVAVVVAARVRGDSRRDVGRAQLALDEDLQPGSFLRSRPSV
jgi:hypothetical protein